MAGGSKFGSLMGDGSSRGSSCEMRRSLNSSHESRSVLLYNSCHEFIFEYFKGQKSSISNYQISILKFEIIRVSKIPYFQILNYVLNTKKDLQINYMQESGKRR